MNNNNNNNNNNKNNNNNNQNNYFKNGYLLYGKTQSLKFLSYTITYIILLLKKIFEIFFFFIKLPFKVFSFILKLFINSFFTRFFQIIGVIIIWTLKKIYFFYKGPSAKDFPLQSNFKKSLFGDDFLTQDKFNFSFLGNIYRPSFLLKPLIDLRHVELRVELFKNMLSEEQFKRVYRKVVQKPDIHIKIYDNKFNQKKFNFSDNNNVDSNVKNTLENFKKQINFSEINNEINLDNEFFLFLFLIETEEFFKYCSKTVETNHYTFLSEERMLAQYLILIFNFVRKWMFFYKINVILDLLFFIIFRISLKEIVKFFINYIKINFLSLIKLSLVFFYKIKNYDILKKCYLYFFYKIKNYIHILKEILFDFIYIFFNVFFFFFFVLPRAFITFIILKIIQILFVRLTLTFIKNSLIPKKNYYYYRNINKAKNLAQRYSLIFENLRDNSKLLSNFQKIYIRNYQPIINKDIILNRAMNLQENFIQEFIAVSIQPGSLFSKKNSIIKLRRLSELLNLWRRSFAISYPLYYRVFKVIYYFLFYCIWIPVIIIILVYLFRFFIIPYYIFFLSFFGYILINERIRFLLINLFVYHTEFLYKELSLILIKNNFFFKLNLLFKKFSLIVIVIYNYLIQLIKKYFFKLFFAGNDIDFFKNQVYDKDVFTKLLSVEKKYLELLKQNNKKISEINFKVIDKNFFEKFIKDINIKENFLIYSNLKDEYIALVNLNLKFKKEYLHKFNKHILNYSIFILISNLFLFYWKNNKLNFVNFNFFIKNLFQLIYYHYFNKIIANLNYINLYEKFLLNKNFSFFIIQSLVFYLNVKIFFKKFIIIIYMNFITKYLLLIFNYIILYFIFFNLALLELYLIITTTFFNILLKITLNFYVLNKNLILFLINLRIIKNVFSLILNIILIFIILFLFFIFNIKLGLQKIFILEKIENFYSIRDKGLVNVITILYTILLNQNIRVYLNQKKAKGLYNSFENKFFSFPFKRYTKRKFFHLKLDKTLINQFENTEEKKKYSYIVFNLFKKDINSLIENVINRENKKKNNLKIYENDLVKKIKMAHLKELIENNFALLSDISAVGAELLTLNRKMLLPKEIRFWVDNNKFTDIYFREFIIKRFLIRSSLLTKEGSRSETLKKWVSNYQINLEAYKRLITKDYSSIKFRNNIPRSVSSQLYFHGRMIVIKRILYKELKINFIKQVVLNFMIIFVFSLIIFEFYIKNNFYSVNDNVYLILVILSIFITYIVSNFFTISKLKNSYLLKFKKLHAGNLLAIWKPYEITGKSYFYTNFFIFFFKLFNKRFNLIKLSLNSEFNFQKMIFSLYKRTDSLKCNLDVIKLLIYLFILFKLYLLIFNIILHLILFFFFLLNINLECNYIFLLSENFSIFFFNLEKLFFEELFLINVELSFFEQVLIKFPLIFFILLYSLLFYKTLCFIYNLILASTYKSLFFFVWDWLILTPKLKFKIKINKNYLLDFEFSFFFNNSNILDDDKNFDKELSKFFNEDKLYNFKKINLINLEKEIHLVKVCEKLKVSKFKNDATICNKSINEILLDKDMFKKN
jgi:hypothetical protein